MRRLLLTYCIVRLLEILPAASLDLFLLLTTIVLIDHDDGAIVELEWARYGTTLVLLAQILRIRLHHLRPLIDIAALHLSHLFAIILLLRSFTARVNTSSIVRATVPNAILLKDVAA